MDKELKDYLDYQSERISCPSCGRKIKRMSIFTCHIDCCGKEFCEDCGEMAVGGIHVCSDSCSSRYAQIYIDAKMSENGVEGNNEQQSEQSSSESCCYITSACLDDLKISRNCPEMKAMKAMTQNYILKSFGGIRDYIKYGKRAPRIVENIRKRSDFKQIWEDVYGQLQQVTEVVGSKNYSEGYRLYKSLVLGLEAKIL